MIKNNEEIMNLKSGVEFPAELLERRLRFGDVFLLIFGHFFLSSFLFVLFCVCTGINNLDENAKNLINEDNEKIASTKKQRDQQEQEEQQTQQERRAKDAVGDDNANDGGELVIDLVVSEKAQVHPLERLLESSRGGGGLVLVFMLVFVSAVISAPLCEEFLYRSVFVGWLRFSVWEHLLESGVGGRSAKNIGVFAAVICPAIFFAILHVGTGKKLSSDALFCMIFAVTLSNLTVFSAGIFYLTVLRKFTLMRLGIRVPNRQDFFVAVVVSLLVIPPMLVLTYLLRELCPGKVVDPVPLFIFAVVLGVVFLRTKSLIPCIFAHAILNCYSFTIMLIK
ncbi:MAG: CPBP family intramembrane metalloprotease [Planctomycetaceae bacterium]|nr:CPBP family intramembrane metalloprotease [Planctomycetaceae bacterium]